MLTSVHFVSELEEFEARRRKKNEQSPKLARRDSSELVEIDYVRNSLLCALQGSVVQRYTVFAMTKIASSLCLLSHRLVVYRSSSSRAVLPSLEDQRETMGFAYWIVPTMLLVVDTVEVIAMLRWMMWCYAGNAKSIRSVSQRFLQPIYYLCFIGVLCHICTDPVNSRIGMRFC
jgi:hypothetical protein